MNAAEIELKRKFQRELLSKIEATIFDFPERLDEWELIESLGADRPACKLALIHRFGLLGESRKTLEATGKIIQNNRERVRQFEAKGLRILRHPQRFWLYPLIKNERLFQAIVGTRCKNIFDFIMNNHFWNDPRL